MEGQVEGPPMVLVWPSSPEIYLRWVEETLDFAEFSSKESAHAWTSAGKTVPKLPESETITGGGV